MQIFISVRINRRFERTMMRRVKYGVATGRREKQHARNALIASDFSDSTFDFQTAYGIDRQWQAHGQPVPAHLVAGKNMYGI